MTRFGSLVSASWVATKRTASSACLRIRNWPTWLPTTPAASSRRASGSRTTRLANATTPSVLPAESSGRTKEPRMP